MHIAFEDIKAGNMSRETAMIRTQIYLTKQLKEAIERLSDERKTTQSNIIREAIDEYVSKKQNKPSKKSIRDFAGIWKDKKDIPNVRKTKGRVGAKVKPIEIRMIVDTNILIDYLKGKQKALFLSYIPTKILIFKS